MMYSQNDHHHVIAAQPGWFILRFYETLNREPVVGWLVETTVNPDEADVAAHFPRPIGIMSGNPGVDSGWAVEGPDGRVWEPEHEWSSVDAWLEARDLRGTVRHALRLPTGSTTEEVAAAVERLVERGAR